MNCSPHNIHPGGEDRKGEELIGQLSFPLSQSLTHGSIIRPHRIMHMWVSGGLQGSLGRVTVGEPWDRSCSIQAGGEALSGCVSVYTELIQWLRSMETGEAESSGIWSVGCDFWEDFLKTTQPLFVLLLPCHRDSMAAEVPSLLEPWGKFKDKSHVPKIEEHEVIGARGPWWCAAPLCTCQHPSFFYDRENNLICLSHYNQVSVTGSQMKFLNDTITVWKHPVISFPMDK